jgi:uncharacterized membrane protein YbhN (UPF0104 family)
MATTTTPPAGTATTRTDQAATATPLESPADRAPQRSARRRLRNGIVVAAALSGVLLGVVLAVPGLRAAVAAARSLSPAWIAMAIALELVSCLGYVVAFALVFDAPARGPAARVAWSELAFGAVVPIGGAGGIALGGWMLRRRGMTLTAIAERSAVLFWLTSAVNVAGLSLAGIALAAGLSGPRQALLGLVPAAVGLLTLGLFAALPRATRHLPAGRAGSALRAAAATVTGTERVLARPNWRLLGAIAYPGADIAVLWCCCAAIGVHPPIAGLVCAYFVGYLFDVLPIPGGLGVLDAGLGGALILYRVPAAHAVTAVLLYHAIALWLPTIGGTIAFLSARHDLHPPPDPAPALAGER